MQSSSFIFTTNLRYFSPAIRTFLFFFIFNAKSDSRRRAAKEENLFFNRDKPPPAARSPQPATHNPLRTPLCAGTKDTPGDHRLLFCVVLFQYGLLLTK